MQQLIIGVLLVIIIVLSGWLTYFYNRMVNKRIIVDNSWDQLDLYLKKRNDMLHKTDTDTIQLVHELKDLEEKIEVCGYIYDNAVNSYNKSVTVFPGNASVLILGLKQLPHFKEEGKR